MSQQYSNTNDNEGSNVPYVQGQTGEFAGLDEIAGLKGDETDLLAMAEQTRMLFEQFTDYAVTETQVVGRTVYLVPGHAVLFTALDVDGVEYEVFLQQRVN